MSFKGFWLLISLLTAAFVGTAQQVEDSLKAQTPLQATVRAYEQNRRLLEVPAAISTLGANELNRFNNTSFLQALNAMPGIRMEERSPGSYRLNIRGSSLRSPFGVRNVKIYYNGIPLTDPGGNTYLNQLGFYNVQNIEVIKGPASSLYGAGTGGVMLLQSDNAENQGGIRVDYSAGSYNLHNTNVNVRTGNADHFSSVNYQHQTSDGYRDHAAMRRDVVAWNASMKIRNNELSGHLLYGDLYYQTPGALTLTEYNINQRAARPKVGAVPGSDENKAAIYLKTFFAGTSYRQQFGEEWQNTTALYGSFTELKNPAIRNYGRNAEPHFGGRTVFQYRHSALNRSQLILHFGVEYQKAFNTVQVFRNKKGNPDSLLTNDEINNSQGFIFTQLSWQIKNWVFTGGLSLNKTKVALSRTSNVPFTSFERNFNDELAPRVAVLNKISDALSVYGSFARGFSPPAVSELSPSGSSINADLNAENGNNYELGMRGNALRTRLYWDINAFYYQLTNSIVQRRDAFGGDYFTNAGSTRQKGLETYISYRLFNKESQPLNISSKIWVSYTWYNFHYNNFKQLTNDFSGNRLPSVPPKNFTVGLDLYSARGFYGNLTYNYTDPIPLNDANSAFANSYNLLGFRTGYKTNLGKNFRLEVFAGADNLFDVSYSLGNDINAAVSRYYNAAAGRNYFAGITLQQLWTRKE